MPTFKSGGGISIPKHRPGSLAARLAQPNVAAMGDPLTQPNRIALLLDASGSMAGERNAKLQEACAGFISACDFSNTAVGIDCFGAAIQQPLTCFQPLLMTTVMSIPAAGGTPLAESMNFVLNSWPITRAVVVSDGQPDDPHSCYDFAKTYGEVGIPVDCVHINSSSAGEECLRRIAELSGGQFIKFTDIQAFSRSFKYLTPALYGQLTSGSVTVAQLGGSR